MKLKVWRWVLPVILVTALAGYWQMPQPANQQLIEFNDHQSVNLPTRFTLLNWNIQKRSYELAWQQQFDEISNHFQPQLITLQEAAYDAALGNPLPYSGNYAPNLGQSGVHSGVFTASTELSQGAEPLLSKVTEPLSNTPKVALLSRYQIGQQQLLIINIHAINFVDNDDYHQQLSAVAAKAAAHQGPLIISGDFNSWSESRTTMLNQQMQQLGLRAVQFSEQQQLKAFFGHQLDHIYVSNHFKVIDARALPSYQVSDHIPMIVTLELQ